MGFWKWYKERLISTGRFLFSCIPFVGGCALVTFGLIGVPVVAIITCNWLWLLCLLFIPVGITLISYWGYQEEQR